MFKKYRHIHFIGIGGIGMSGIAEVLINLGYHVSGSDACLSDTTARLKHMGAQIFSGHDEVNIANAHVIVVSSAISKTNPEVMAAKKQNIVVVPRAAMLAELMRLKYGIAVAGTHGKTSTTSMIGHVLHKSDVDPTVIIGGKVNNFQSNAKLGQGDFLVAEADESDRSFLKLTPTIGIITNIDPEHMENYTNFDDMQQAYIDFANKVPFYGAAIVCDAHPVIRRIIKRIQTPVITYGRAHSDYHAKNIEQNGASVHFDAYFQTQCLGRIDLCMCGMHHIQNALATIAAARHLDVSFSAIRLALKSFSGIKRRFDILHHANPIVVDDYAHHPVEIDATLVAVKKGWPRKRRVVVMQPHRYSRLKQFYNEFIDSLKLADIIIIMDVYAAGEKQDKQFSGEKLWKDVCRTYPKKTIQFAPTMQAVMEVLAPLYLKTDLILFLGAGNVTNVAKMFAKSLI